MTLLGYEWTLYGGLAVGMFVLLFVVWFRCLNLKNDSLKLKFFKLSSAFKKEVEDSFRKLNAAILNAKKDLELSKKEFENWAEIEKENILRNNNYYQGFFSRAEEENKHMSLQFKNVQRAKEIAINEVNSWRQNAEEEIELVQNKIRTELEEFEHRKKNIIFMLKNLVGELEVKIYTSGEKKWEQLIADLLKEIKRLD